MATNNLDLLSSSLYINLVTFSWAGGASVARYCSSDKSYNDGSHTWSAIPSLAVDLGKQTGGVKDEQATILISPVDPIITMLVGYPFSRCTVKIEELDPTDATTRRVTFFGVVQLVTGNKNGLANQCEIKVDGLRAALDNPLGIPALNTCAWQFGDKNCTLNVPGLAATVTRTVSGFSGNLVTIGSLPSSDDYVRGFLTFAGLSILIRSQNGTTQLELFNPAPPSWNGQAVIVTPGCRKNVADCTKWANLVNFGGFGIGIPNFHPSAELQ